MVLRLPRQPSIIRRSLKIKFPLISAAIFLVIFGLASAVLIRQNISFQKQSLLSQAKTFSTLATKPIGDSYNVYFQSGFLKFREQLLDTLVIDDEITRIQMISVEGKILFDTINIDGQVDTTPTPKISDGEIVKAVAAGRVTELQGKNGDVTEIIVPYFDDFGARPFSIRYFISYDSIYESINNSILTIGFLTLVFLILTLGSMTILVHKSILTPLDKMVLTAREISRGKLQRNIELSTGDELADLATSLNQMTATLRKNIEDLKQLDKLKDEFIYLASHNLRSPLTAIKGYIEILRENKSLDQEAKEAARKIAISSERLEELTESLLSLGTLEENKQPLLMKSVGVEKLLEDVVEKYAPKISEKKINLVFEFPRGKTPKIELDKLRISQALESLIDNAIKFNHEEGKIIIGLKKVNGFLRIYVRDNGIGISKEERLKAFQKFHRATDVLTYNYKGIGLGLYITKLIIEAHRGKIWFESKLGRGTTFYVELPIKEAGSKD